MSPSDAPVLPRRGGPARPAVRRATAVVLVLSAIVGARTGLATPVRISSSSMLPTLAAGDVVVTLLNDSNQPQTLLVLDSAGTAMHDEIKASSKGDDASTTVALQPGTYTVICTISGHSNMKADLVVS